VVIGAGQAGLAMAYFLARQGRRFVILERADSIGAAWRERWDSLTLFTPRRYNKPAAIRALLELDNTLFTGSVILLAAFYAGVALSVVPLRSLPIWLGWWAAAQAALFAIAFLGVFSDDYEGPLFDIVLPLALLGHLLWVLTAGVLMLRHDDRTVPGVGSTRS
jgi:hypothetical protein